MLFLLKIYPHPENIKKYPILGSIDERNKYTLYMNKKIKEYCLLNKFIYIDIYDKYCKNNYLNNDYSKDGTHITNTKFIDDFFLNLQI